MKLNIGDVVTVQGGSGSYRVRVEDASKGDVIQGKIESISGQGAPGHETGKVYEFARKDIK